MASTKDNHYKDRLLALVQSLRDPHSSLHIDALLDCMNAIVYELDGKTIAKNKKFGGIYNRLLPTSEYIQKQRINLSDFTTLKVLGKGAFGEVALVRHNATSHVYALKTMNKFEMVKRDEALCLWEEREIMALSNSDWIVRMYYAFQDNVNIYMVMEFVQGGDMVNFMGANDIDEDVTRFYIGELSVALDFLHNLGFIHRDVKPDNMLLDKTGHLKLCDFGTCIRMDKNGKVTCSIAVGTPDYISPEILASQSSSVTYGKETDWWSVGVFLYELLIGDTPFYSQSLVGTYSKILNYRKSLSIPEDVEISKEAESLIKAFLTDPDKRMGRNGLEEIKRHPFFKNVPWSWDTIRQSKPPVVPELSNDLDTSCFEEQSDSKGISFENRSTAPFGGDHFPFVGFSFSRDFEFGALTEHPNQSGAKQQVSAAVKPGDSSQLDEKLSQEMKINAQLKSKIDELTKRLLDKEKSFVQIQEQLRQLESKGNSLENNAEAQSNRNDLEKYKTENEKLMQKLKALEAELNEHKRAAKLMEGQIKTLKVNELANKNRLEDILKENKPMKELIESLKQQKQSSDSQIEKLNKDLQEAKNSSSEININFNKLKNEHDQISKEIQDLKKIIDCNTIDQIGQYVRTMRSDHTMMESKINSYEAEIKKYEQIIKKQQPAENVDTIQLTRKYNSLLVEKDTLSSQVNDYKKISADLSLKCDFLSQKIRETTNENTTLSQKLNDLTFKHTALTLLEGKITGERNELQTKYNEIITKNDELITKIRTCETKISELEEQLSMAQLQMNLQSKSIEELRADVNSRETAITEVKSDLSRMNEKNDELAAQISAKENEISELSQKVVKLDTELFLHNTDILEMVEKTSEMLSPTAEDKEKKPQLGQHDEIVERLKSELKQVKKEFQDFKTLSEKSIENERQMKEVTIQKLLDQVTKGTKTKPTDALASIRIKSGNRNERKFEQQYKQMQMDFMKETTKHAETVKSYEARINEMNLLINELQSTIEGFKKEKLMEMKQSNVSLVLNDGNTLTSQPDIKDALDVEEGQIIKQSFLFLPSKSGKSSRKINWNRVIGTLTTNSFSIYKDEDSSPNNLISSISLHLIYYVRAISQNDLIRCPAGEIPKIFQIIYSDEEALQEPSQSDPSSDKCTMLANHCLINIQYHMPATCDVCGKGLWGFIKSSYAMECKNCHFKCHKEHALDPKSIPGCRDYDKKMMAKELILMAISTREQKNWIDILLGLMKAKNIGNPLARVGRAPQGYKPSNLSSVSKQASTETLDKERSQSRI